MSTNVFKHIKENAVVSVFCDETCPDMHLTGFIHALSEKEVIIRHISPAGRYDGYILIHCDDIYRVDVQGKYENKIQKLYTIKGQRHPNFSAHSVGEGLIAKLLAFCKEHNFFATFELEDSELTGIISAFDLEYIKLRLVDEFGNADGETILQMGQVISVSVDSEKEQDRKLLFETC